MTPTAILPVRLQTAHYPGMPGLPAVCRTAVIYFVGPEEHFALSRSLAAPCPSCDAPGAGRHHGHTRLPQSVWRPEPLRFDGRGHGPAALVSVCCRLH